MNQSNPDFSQMTSRQVRDNCKLDEHCQEILHNAVLDCRLTAKGHDDILRAAKRLAFDAGSDEIDEEALQAAIENHRNKLN